MNGWFHRNFNVNNFTMTSRTYAHLILTMSEGSNYNNDDYDDDDRYFLSVTVPTVGWRSTVTLWRLLRTKVTFCGYRPPSFAQPARLISSISRSTYRSARWSSDHGLTMDGSWISISTATLEMWSVYRIRYEALFNTFMHSVPPKWDTYFDGKSWNNSGTNGLKDVLVLFCRLGVFTSSVLSFLSYVL